MTSTSRTAPRARRVASTPEPAATARLDTPLGAMLAAVDSGGRLLRLDFADGRDRPTDEERLAAALARAGFAARSEPRALAHVADALEAWFERDFAPLEALEPRLGGTPFQREVWQALRAVPRGTTTSYAALARAVGRPNAARAVGAANGANVLALVVPCHRAVGANGALTGYAGGLERKLALLELESDRT